MYGEAVPCFKQKIWTCCRKASLPFPGEMDLGCGITLDIFTHVFIRVVLKFIIIYITQKKKEEIQVGDLGEGYNVVTCLKERRTR